MPSPFSKARRDDQQMAGDEAQDQERQMADAGVRERAEDYPQQPAKEYLKQPRQGGQRPGRLAETLFEAAPRLTSRMMPIRSQTIPLGNISGQRPNRPE